MSSQDLPLILAGPLLRRVTPRRLNLWLALRQPVGIRLTLQWAESGAQHYTLEPGTAACRLQSAGERLHFVLVDIKPGGELPDDTWIDYRLELADAGGAWVDCAGLVDTLNYPGRDCPGFKLPARVSSILHGSCRKPHHPGGDGLLAADALLERLLAGSEARDDARPEWPSALVLSGDQVYADDVAGPLLRRIHRVIPLLGLPDEPFTGAGVDVAVEGAAALYRHPDCYYRREALLPRHRRNLAPLQALFGGVEKPVFTTVNAHNHLITLGEMLAMYLLVWSPALWELSTPAMPPGLDARQQARYREEEAALADFAAGLHRVQRLFAHLPVAMIFDDHDVTDDWNLSRAWEEAAYGNPFSSRVLGNALLAYLLCQGWGNNPEAFDEELLQRVQRTLAAPGGEDHDALLHDLQRFDQWHYHWPTTPPLVVADCRTHRWRSESAARKPSGLMDWEALTDLQHELRGLPAVLLVSSAPIFGVKLIEVIQRVFTWFGQPLMVDAENWMSHKGAASAILNIFRHSRTPGHFVILSGDVHYSFVYDVELRGRTRGPDIYQICSSGLRNTFPRRLLAILDRANRWLYHPRSPLNWLTRRRRMRVIPRKPEGTAHGRRLLNGCGVGLVELDDDGVPRRICQLLADGGEVDFSRREAESRWR
ncbi:alkaline phosphatase family protein [Parahaliea mediterranea]|uniref:Alkaline phosphatase family protein n=1 Tax=Parahaliea mediterranea TaxID=651086 RepID=A0A939IML0_9GAMM|nr:alkaline phosphatase family protein [Parahaliea mediterranea]MBN7797148.1 alkaline phosphatase family protein [Parahaliea mediterranea]